MSALAEALLAAQRQAVAALSKEYLANREDDASDASAALSEALDAIGCTDTVEQGYLLTALEYLRQLGGEAPKPTGQTAPTAPEPAREAQLSLIKRLCKERNLPEPDVVSSKDEASKIIDSIKDGTYNADAYTVPF